MARRHRTVILFFLALFLVITAGCTPEQEQKVRELIGEHRCQAFNGYICSAPDDCALPYLDTIESYCCPIKCMTCNQSCDDSIETTEDYCSKETGYECRHNKICPKTCDDDNSCTDDYCSESTEYECVHEELKPCPNDGICEKKEFRGNIHTYCPNSEAVLESARAVISSNDCPENCNDAYDDGNGRQYENNPNTEDWYDFETQECKHKTCEVSIETTNTLNGEETNNLQESNADITPPKINGIIINPKTITGTGIVSVTFEVTDDLSGFRQGQVWWMNPRGNTMTGDTIGESGIKSTPYRLEFEVKPYMEKGIYSVDINLEDNAFNRKYYSGKNDFDGTFEVI